MGSAFPRSVSLLGNATPLARPGQTLRISGHHEFLLVACLRAHVGQTPIIPRWVPDYLPVSVPHMPVLQATKWSTHGLHLPNGLVYTRSTLGRHLVCTWSTHGLHLVYKLLCGDVCIRIEHGLSPVLVFFRARFTAYQCRTGVDQV